MGQQACKLGSRHLRKKLILHVGHGYDAVHQRPSLGYVRVHRKSCCLPICAVFMSTFLTTQLNCCGDDAAHRVPPLQKHGQHPTRRHCSRGAGEPGESTVPRLVQQPAQRHYPSGVGQPEGPEVACYNDVEPAERDHPGGIGQPGEPAETIPLRQPAERHHPSRAWEPAEPNNAGPLQQPAERHHPGSAEQLAKPAVPGT